MRSECALVIGATQRDLFDPTQCSCAHNMSNRLIYISRFDIYIYIYSNSIKHSTIDSMHNLTTNFTADQSSSGQQYKESKLILTWSFPDNFLPTFPSSVIPWIISHLGTWPCAACVLSTSL